MNFKASTRLVCMVACISCAPQAVLKHGPPPPPAQAFQLTVGGEIFRQADSLGFVSAESFKSGDKFRLTIRTTQAVQVYVAYCDANQKLQTYPAIGALSPQPNTDLYVPQSGSFVVDTRDAGSETLYVVASASALEKTDPALARKLSAAVSPANASTCAPELEMTTDESRASVGLAPVSGEAPSARTAAVETEPVVPPAAVASSPVPAAGKRQPHRSRMIIREDWRPRGIGVQESSTAASSVASDSSGVAILAFRKPHISER